MLVEGDFQENIMIVVSYNQNIFWIVFTFNFLTFLKSNILLNYTYKLVISNL